MTGVGYLVGFRFTQGGVLAALAALRPDPAARLRVLVDLGDDRDGGGAGSVEGAQSASFIWVFPLIFASSVFVPIEGMPSVLQAIARNNPITIWANTARALTVGPVSIPPGQ